MKNLNIQSLSIPRNPSIDSDLDTNETQDSLPSWDDLGQDVFENRALEGLSSTFQVPTDLTNPSIITVFQEIAQKNSDLEILGERRYIFSRNDRYCSLDEVFRCLFIGMKVDVKTAILGSDFKETRQIKAFYELIPWWENEKMLQLL